MNFAAHPERFAQVNRLHEGGQTADVTHTAAADVAGAGLDPLGAHIHFAFARLGPTDREGGLLREPDVG